MITALVIMICMLCSSSAIYMLLYKGIPLIVFPEDALCWGCVVAASRRWLNAVLDITMIYFRCMLCLLGPCTFTNLFHQKKVIITPRHPWCKGQISPNELQSDWFIHIHFSCTVVKYFSLELTRKRANALLGFLIIVNAFVRIDMFKFETETCFLIRLYINLPDANNTAPTK